MKILLTNDDGINAEGIQTLEKYLRQKWETIVVAPSEERSTTGQSLSLDRPLRLEMRQANQYACSGFPADCALLGITHFGREKRPDVVVSGINKGANLGQDLYYSGTVAAARQAAFQKVPAIAVSLVFTSLTHGFFYETAALVVEKLLTLELFKHIPQYSLININVPNVPLDQLKGFRWTTIGMREYTEDIHERLDARGNPYFWIAGQLKGHVNVEGSDCSAIAEGYVAVTPHELVQVCHYDFRRAKEIVEKANLSGRE